MVEIRASPKIEEKKKEPTSQNFVLRLWIETESYNIEDVLNRLPRCFSKFAYCIHDRDIYEDDNAERNVKKGDIKKAHIHIYGKRSQCTVFTVANLLGVHPYDVQITHDRIQAIQYLIHKNNPEKAQYFMEEVVSNFDCAKWLDDMCEENRVRVILDYVTSGKRTTFESCMYALENNCWSEFRRSYSIIKDIMNEVRI